VALVDAATFAPADARTDDALLLLAARVGGTRLIDNAPLTLRTGMAGAGRGPDAAGRSTGGAA